jgi:hypothetical protein
LEKPAEILLFDFLTEQFAAAPVGSTLDGVELHDTVYQKITKTRGVRISDAIGTLSPNAGGELAEFDVQIILSCWSKIDSTDIKNRQPALVNVFAIQKAVQQLLLNDSTLGGRVCDSLVRQSGRGYDKNDEGVFAVVNTPFVINPRELGR